MDLEIPKKAKTTWGKDFESEAAVEAYFDKWAPDYENDLVTAKLLPQLARCFQVSDLTPTAVYDFGCGTGLGGQWFVQKGIPVHGCDISPRMMLHAQARGYTSLVWADLTKPFKPDESFDTAISIGVIGDYVPTTLLHNMRTAKNIIFSIEERYLAKNPPQWKQLLPDHTVSPLPQILLQHKSVQPEVLTMWLAKQN